MFKTFIVPAFVAALAVAAPAVHAADRTPEKLVVPVAKVDFNNAGQVQALYDRISAAARSVCQSDADDVFTRADDRACERQAMRDAIADLNQPALYRVAARESDAGRPQLAFNSRR